MRFRSRCILAASLVAACCTFAATRQANAKTEKPAAAELQKTIDRLIRDLDAEEFVTREKAEQQLTKIGKPAYEAVKKATRSKSTEVKLRAGRILEKIAVLLRNFEFVDVQPQANVDLKSSFHSYEGNNLAGLKQGKQAMGGVRFDIGKKMMQLASSKTEGFPEKITGVTVRKPAWKIHFLHATGWGSPSTVDDGTRIGSYVVHYADKSKETIPIEYGVDVRDWWNWDDSKPCKRGKVAWRGSNPAADKYRDENPIPLRLYCGSWKNPHPEKTIVSIDYISTNNTICAPFCIAITLEQPAEKSGAKDKAKPAAKR